MNSSVGPYLQIGAKLKMKQNFLHEYRNYDTRKRMHNSTFKITIIESLLPLALLLLFFV